MSHTKERFRVTAEVGSSRAGTSPAPLYTNVGALWK